MSSALMVFLPACSAKVSASLASCSPYSSSNSLSACLAGSLTRSAPACFMSCSIAASGMSRFDVMALLYWFVFK